jgi:hypothetical protein
VTVITKNTINHYIFIVKPIKIDPRYIIREGYPESKDVGATHNAYKTVTRADFQFSPILSKYSPLIKQMKSRRKPDEKKRR